MGFLDGAIDLFGRNLAIFLGLLIPFLGILVPALVILAFGVSHREPPRVASDPAGLATETDVEQDGPPAVSTEVAVAARERPHLMDSGELSWLCERLRESDVFEGLTDDELRLVAAIGERRQVAAGQRLASAGSRGESLFLILKGEIRLLSHTAGEDPVRVAHAGETVPLAAIIDPPVLVTTAEAATDGEVFAIPRAPLLDLLETQPMIGLQVYRAAAKSFEHRYRQTLDHGGNVIGGGA